MESWLPISWPALLIGLVVLTYWARVMVMVRITKKQAGHHANLIPEEPLGRILRIVWFPVIFLWFMLPLMASYGIGSQFFLLRALFYSSIAAWVAILIAFVAYGITWVCWMRMGKSWRMGIDPADKTQLVFNGPFAYVRNPIYGLSSAIMFMTMVIDPSPLMLLVGITHILLLQWEVRREEVYLSALHGESYIKYRDTVGRFLPRSLRAYRP